MKLRWKQIILVFVLVILACTVHHAQRMMDKGKNIQFELTQPVFLPKGETLKLLSMGYRGLMADALWIRSVLYYGRRAKDHDNPYYMYQAHDHDHHHHSTHHAADDSIPSLQEKLHHILFNYENKGLVDFIYPMLDRVTTLDPYFIHPYISGGVYVLMETGEIEASLALLEKGRQYNPEVWKLPFYIGWIHWMYLEDTETARQYLLEALSKPGCPQIVQPLIASLSRDSDQVNATTLYLKGLYQSTDNAEIRERVMHVLNELKEEAGT